MEDKGSTSIESIESFFELSKIEILRGTRYSSPLLLSYFYEAGYVVAVNKARDVREVGHYPHGNTERIITDPGEISYILTLIKQAYEKN